MSKDERESWRIFYLLPYFFFPLLFSCLSLRVGAIFIFERARAHSIAKRATRSMLFKIKLKEAFVFNFVEIPGVSSSFVLRDSIIVRNVCGAISIAKSDAASAGLGRSFSIRKWRKFAFSKKKKESNYSSN